MARFKDLTGQTFGRLTVVGKSKTISGSRTKWDCICSCGGIKSVFGDALTRGATISCGCFRKEVTKARSVRHGMFGTSTYRSWAHMVGRCRNQKDAAYSEYGARGINVCDEWLLFENFYADMGECPSGHSIDRIDNNSGYCKENCRWADKSTQNNNKRSNNMISYMGETLSHCQWSSRLGGNSGLVAKRIREGWSEEDAVTIKPAHRSPRCK